MRAPLIASLFAGLAVVTACESQLAATIAAPAAPALALTCFRENGHAMLAAHRGGPAAGYPENALSSLQRLADLGVLYAEVDVRRSVDGTLFLLHDDTLDRTTTGQGDAEGQDWSELSGFQLRDNDGQLTEERIPTLADAVNIARVNGVILNLDLKSVDATEIVSFIHDHDARDLVAIIAYTVDDAAALHALDPGLVLSVPNELAALAAAGVNLETSYIWLGTGAIDASADAALAGQGLESSAGLFRREDGSADPYLEARAAGIELLSIDNVDAAVAALGGSAQLKDQIATCAP
ncbi:glycerophosphodiester phosphodiesterase family protein [Maricaulis maris]|uniref:Glycerophosphoryl diester phosphodiesterase n=1 Tax=Maricaulis maris TaxID=74318 RepID=A0A495D4A1_9PROT|nr:glycerophosphodiester phosphodiesterase family protein [Maricaulis maris]RKQ96735.1 glycerophosphoryl diester phosphodiesterase [Maricaulis maris]